MKKLHVFSAILLAGMLMVSCEKYPDGGLVKKGDDRLEGTWTLSNYYRNGADETKLILITAYQESYQTGGVFSRSYKDGNGSTVSETGTWEMPADNLTVNLMGISSISNFSNSNSTLSTSAVTITRMKKSEYWYEFTNGGDVHEFRFNR